MAADGIGIVVSIIGFGLVFGLSARLAGFSIVEAAAMSSVVFAGASQFAAVGALAGGAGWPAVIVLAGLLNARHLLYSSVLAPWFSGTSRLERALAAHVLTDEAFALSITHFRRLGRADVRGYFASALLTVFVPWNLSTVTGFLLGSGVPDPARLGLDVVFPAAMAGLAVGLLAGRQEVVAAAAGAAIAVVAGVAWGTSVGIMAGGLLGPVAGLLVPPAARLAVPVTPAPALSFHSPPETGHGDPSGSPWTGGGR
jgi:4-azaleucine resistance transporter AzlC